MGSKKQKGGRPKKRQRIQLPAFHIFCEGKNTEPLYFNAFPVNNIAFCKGNGESKNKLVDSAIKYKNFNKLNSGKTKDQVWVVFDMDYDGTKPNQNNDYNSAIERAESNNIKWAVSNDSFELWYVLHFQNSTAQQDRTWYNDRLTVHLGEKYDKNRALAIDMFDRTKPNLEDALLKADALEANYNRADRQHATKNPYTTVHHLVRELQKYFKPT
jgi:hypothetical protein